MKIILLHCGVGLEDNEFKPRVHPDTIHHGLCSISAYIKNKGYNDVQCINLCRMKNIAEFKKTAKKIASQTDVFAVSMMSADVEAALKCIKIIKSINSKIKVVVGGIHPTIMLHEVEPYKEIDYIITGEGEISFANLLNSIKNNLKAKRIIQGIRPENLDELPFIDSELMGRLESAYMPILQEPFVSIITGRGCIYNCKFCQPSEKILFGKKVRRRSVQNVIQELITLYNKYKYNSLMIHDDCLTEDKEWIQEFCNEYERANLCKPFFIQSRVDFICKNEPIMERLAEIGLKLVSIGFESGSQRILNFLNKGTTVEQNIKASKICHKYGIKIKGNFMFGVPTETKTEAKETLKMIQEIKPYKISVTFFTPLPGSDLFKFCENNNLSLLQNHNNYNRSDLSSAKIKGVDYDFLRDITAQIYETQTFLEDNIQGKIDSLPNDIKSNLKILMFRSAPVKTVKKILTALGINNLKIDLIVQSGFSRHFSDTNSIATKISIDCEKFTKSVFADFIPLLKTAKYNTAIIPLNCWDYYSYQDIYETCRQIGIEYIFGIAPDSQIIELKSIFTTALV